MNYTVLRFKMQCVCVSVCVCARTRDARVASLRYTHTHTHTHTIAKHSTTIVAECESSSVGVKQKACPMPIGAFL